MNLTVAKWAFGVGVVTGVAVVSKGPDAVRKLLQKRPKPPPSPEVR